MLFFNSFFSHKLTYFNYTFNIPISGKLLKHKLDCLSIVYIYMSYCAFSPTHFYTVSKKEVHFWSTSQLRFQLDATMETGEAFVMLKFIYSPRRINLLSTHVKILVTRVRYPSTKTDVVFRLRALPGGRKRFSRLPEKRTGSSIWKIETCLSG